MTTLTATSAAIHNRDASLSTGFMVRVRRFLAYSRAEYQLAQLDDRLLADIGLKRSEITRMVWGE
ncbi:MAG: DUF1127 domain-containing protein [Methylocella sp.]